MIEHGDDFQVPQRIRDAFAGRTYLSTPEVARLLEMNVVTLREMSLAWSSRAAA
jgi:hypothetical protein